MDFSTKNVTITPLSEVYSSEGPSGEMINSRRLTNYSTFWKYYLGNHYNSTESSDESQVTINYCKAIINKLVNFTIFGGINFSCDKWSRKTTLSIIDDVWENNNKKRLLYEISLMSSVTGDNFVEVGWDSENKKILITQLDSAICFPVYDEIDKRIMKKMVIKFKKASTGKSKEKKNDSDDSDEYYIKTITPDEIIIEDGGKSKVTEPNPYGMINIVYWPNTPLPGSSFGLSDIYDLIGLNDEFNEKVTNMSAIINYYESPIVVIYGAKKETLNTGSTFWSVPKDAKVEILSNTANLNASMDFIKVLKKGFHELSGVPARSLGGEEGGISNTSSIALHVEYQPLLEKLEIKRMMFGYGLEKINELILKISAIFDSSLKSKLDSLDGKKEVVKSGEEEREVTVKPYKVYPVFKDPLPKDRLALLQIVTQELQNTINGTPQPLTSINRALEDLGTEDADELLEEIAKDKEKILADSEVYMQMEVRKQANLNSIVQTNQTPKGAKEEISKE